MNIQREIERERERGKKRRKRRIKNGIYIEIESRRFYTTPTPTTLPGR